MANSDLRNKTNITNVSFTDSINIINNIKINTFDYIDKRLGDPDNISFDYSNITQYTKTKINTIFLNDYIDCSINNTFIISNYNWIPNCEYIVLDIENNNYQLYVYTDNSGNAKISKFTYFRINSINKLIVQGYNTQSIVLFKYPIYTHSVNVCKYLLQYTNSLHQTIQNQQQQIQNLQNQINQILQRLN